MKVVAVFIASDENEYYKSAQVLCRKWIHNHPDVTSFFVKTHHRTGIVLNDDVFTTHLEGEESVSNIIIKTIECMRVLLGPEFEWDFLLRTNLSSIFHWGRTLQLLSENSSFDVIAKVVDSTFPTGCGMFLSRHAVRCIVQKWDETGLRVGYDDCIIGDLLKLSGFPVSSWKNVEYHMTDPSTEIDHHSFHRRCKLSCENDDRVLRELPMIHKWVDAWYPGPTP